MNEFKIATEEPCQNSVGREKINWKIIWVMCSKCYLADIRRLIYDVDDQ
jgi:hypothetical protein